MIRYILEGITPSQNVVDNMHWTKRQELRDYWYNMLIGTYGFASDQESKKKYVLITRVANRLIDDLNVPAGCKYILDAFVFYKYLVNDNVQWCRVFTAQRKCIKNEKQHMEIIISDQPLFSPIYPDVHFDD